MFNYSFARGLAGLALMVLAGVANATAVLGPSLQKALATAEAGKPMEVIVSFRGASPLGAAQLKQLTDIGVVGYHFDVLPIAGVVATPEQIGRIAALGSVRSIWANDAMEYDNYEAATITGVQKLRTTQAFLNRNGGLPFTGRGVGVLVNDSGVDGTHDDLKFGENLVQNVIGWTDLGGTAFSEAGIQGIPHFPRIENVPHTDVLLNSHGTHVTGIVGATGKDSGGKYRGVAYEANLVGHSAGVSALLLNLLDGFDYALLRQSVYNIRVVTNSWGNTGEKGFPFNPDDPTNIATKMCSDAGMVVVFSAGNSGPQPNTITGNFKKAPWVVTVAAGSKSGGLMDFSSRGQPGFGTQKVTIGGVQYDLTDRPTVISPGFNIISTRAKSLDPYVMGAGGTLYYDLVAPKLIEPQYLPYYTTISGTSQAAPHIAGIVALLMQANPALTWREVKKILQATATNVPGLLDFEGGAGFVNAWAAMADTLALRTDFGKTNKLLRSFNASIEKVGAGSVKTKTDVLFLPAGPPANVEFDVGSDVVLVTASTDTTASTIGLSLIDPDGKRTSSSIAVGPSTLTVAAPGKPGHWKATLRGIGSIAGVGVAPPVPGVPFNGYGTPEPETVNIELTSGAEQVTGLGDIAGHPLQGFIESAVKHRLLDGRASGLFEPDARLTRIEFAEYLTLGAGIRQNLALNRLPSFTDLSGARAAYAEATSVVGATLKDLDFKSRAPIPRTGTAFGPLRIVSRSQLALGMVGALGKQKLAEAHSGPVTAVDDGKVVPVTDLQNVASATLGYIQLAIDLGLVQPEFVTEPDPVTQAPREVAHFNPASPVTRAEYARAALTSETAYGVNVDSSLELPSLP